MVWHCVRGTVHAMPKEEKVEIDDKKAKGQGCTLVHFSAHLKRFLWHRGCE
jgi:hypothetical protein